MMTSTLRLLLPPPPRRKTDTRLSQRNHPLSSCSASTARSLCSLLPCSPNEINSTRSLGVPGFQLGARVPAWRDSGRRVQVPPATCHLLRFARLRGQKTRRNRFFNFVPHRGSHHRVCKDFEIMETPQARAGWEESLGKFAKSLLPTL